MARYEITAPDGSRHEITAPDDATEEQVLAYAQQQFSRQAAPRNVANQAAPAGAKSKPQSRPFRDTLVGVGMGAADFTNSLAQGIGTLIPDSWEAAAGEKLGMSPSAEAATRSQQEAFGAITNNSTAGKVGRFVGNVAATAPVSSLRVASTAAKVAPQLAKAPAVVNGIAQGGVAGLVLSSANPETSAAAQAGMGGVVGGVANGLIPPALRHAKGAISTLTNGAGKEQTMSRAADLLASKAQGLYKQAEDAGVLFRQSGIQKVANEIKGAVGKPNAILRPKTTGMLQELDELAATGDIPLSQLDEFRQMIGKEMRRAEPSDLRALQIMKDKLDDFGDKAMPDTVTGDYKNGMELIKEARKAWAMKSKAQILDDIFEKAENNTSQYTQSQYLGTVLQKFRQLANEPKKMRAFSKEEQAQIKQIVMGGKSDKVLRLLGKFSPTGAVSTGVGLGATAAMGPAGLVVPAIGAAAKYGATQSTKASIRDLEDLILQGQLPVMRAQAVQRVPNALQSLLQPGYLPQPAPSVSAWSMLAQKPEPKNAP
jgi:hypothetical protein